HDPDGLAGRIDVVVRGRGVFEVGDHEDEDHPHDRKARRQPGHHDAREGDVSGRGIERDLVR
ncbi:hypothetical protein LCGC14_2390920, partial [marine sediment metagenome]